MASSSLTATPVSTSSGLNLLSTLSPEQQTAFTSLLSSLSSSVNSSMTPYTGQTVAGLSDQQKKGLSLLDQYLNQGNSALTQAGLNAYQQVINGVSPQDTIDQYMKYQAPGEQKYLTNTTLPTIKEAQVAGGTLRSSGTQRGIADAVSNLQNTQLSNINSQINTNRTNATSALSLLPAMSNLDNGDITGKLTAAFGYGAVPQTQEQAQLTANLNQYYNTAAGTNPLLDKLLAMLNIGTQASVTQETPSNSTSSSTSSSTSPYPNGVVNGFGQTWNPTTQSWMGGASNW